MKRREARYAEHKLNRQLCEEEAQHEEAQHEEAHREYQEHQLEQELEAQYQEHQLEQDIDAAISHEIEQEQEEEPEIKHETHHELQELEIKQETQHELHELPEAASSSSSDRPKVLEGTRPDYGRALRVADSQEALDMLHKVIDAASILRNYNCICRAQGYNAGPHARMPRAWSRW